MTEKKESQQPVGFIEYIQNFPLGAYAVMFALGGLSILGLKTLQQGWQEPAPIYFQTAQPTVTQSPTSTPEPLNVFINGEVEQPGVYKLPHDSILQDALLLAGGFSAEAFKDVVNLAQPLTDGMQVYVPAIPETEVAIPLISTPPVNAKSETAESNEANSGGLINLNTASKELLESLPGVGPSTAQKIVDYREDNGPFTSAEDVMNVSGIGPAKFESMQDFITVDG